VDSPTVLATMASIAASLVGFSGLLTAFRTANDQLGPRDLNNVRTLLILSVSALVFALLPLPLAASPWAGRGWTVLTILLGANLLFWSVQSPRWMRKKRLQPRSRLLYRLMIAAQGLLGIGLIAGALRLADAAPLYAVGVLWFLIAAVVVFVVQVFPLLPVDGAPPGE
jgi:hypothetical protein